MHNLKTRPAWVDLKAGATSALVALPVAIGGGILLVAPLGQEYASLGVKAGLICAIIAAIVTACFSSSRFSIGGPSTSTSIVLAGTLAHLGSAGNLNAVHIAILVAVMVMLSGLLLMLSGWLGWGNFIKFIPRPVLAGFVNGIALLVVFSQLGAALGLSQALHFSSSLLDEIRWTAPLVTLLTVWICFKASHWKLPLPPQFCGLILGFAVHYLFQSLLGPAQVGPVVGTLPDLHGLPDWLHVFDTPERPAQLPWAQILAGTILLTLMSAFQILMTASALDSRAASSHDANRELVGFGIGNVASALTGGVPSSANLGRAVANYQAGSRSAWSGIFNGLIVCLVVLLAAPWISAIPLAVMAGLLIHSASVMVDTWALGQFRHWLEGRERSAVRENVVVILVMTVGMLWMNPALAVGVGVILTMGLFLKRMAKTFVRCSYDCSAKRSLKVRPAALEQHLASHGHLARVIELQGALFFGTAERLRRLVEIDYRSARYVVLDCRRLGEWDASGVQIAGQLHRRLAEEGRELLLAHVLGNARHEDALRAYGLWQLMPAGHCFPDTDHALEYVENRILASTLTDSPERMQRADLQDTILLHALSEAEQRTLSHYFTSFSVAAGELLFAVGDAGDQLFVLLEGEITIGLPLHAEGGLRRLFTITPGVVFGEMALLDGQPRSASAKVVQDACIKALSRDDFERLRREQPGIFARLMQNIAHEMSLRLRMTNQQLRALEG